MFIGLTSNVEMYLLHRGFTIICSRYNLLIHALESSFPLSVLRAEKKGEREILRPTRAHFIQMRSWIPSAEPLKSLVIPKAERRSR